MTNEEIVLTAKGYEELKAELDDLRTNKRQENIEAIKELLYRISICASI